MTADSSWLREYIRPIENHPKAGVTFYDITPLLAQVDAFRFALDALADRFCGTGVDLVAGIEARGFIFAAPLAYRLGAGFVPVRKPNKLPAPVHSEEYDLEYGTGELQVHVDAIGPEQRVLIVDDVLATGGTAAAAGRLVELAGAELVAFGFLIELEFLGGAGKLKGQEIVSLLSYS